MVAHEAGIARIGLRAMLGALVGALAGLWLRTLRVDVVVSPELAGASGRPWVLAFLHGKQWPLLAWKRRRRTVVMVSWSLDGSMQATALGLLGFSVVRGSSSRGGMRGLATVVRRVRGESADAAFAVDGPRGPYGEAKLGARLAARAVGGVLVPMGSAIDRGKVLERAWDRFEIAWPFSRVVVSLGAPIEPEHVSGAFDAELGAAIKAANAGAGAELLGRESVRGALHVGGVKGPSK